MPVTLEQNETACLLRLEGEVGIFSATELAKLLKEALATEKEIRVDLQGVTDLDVTALQLLWAAGRTASQMGKRFGLVGRIPEPALLAASDSGLESLPILAEAS